MRRPAAATALACLPIGALGLAVLLLVEGTTGRYAVAGLVIGALSVGTGLGIAAQGRLMDRFGPTPVLLAAAGAQLPALAALVLASNTGAPAGLLAVLAFTAGGCEPQVNGALRALWSVLTPPRLQQAGMAWSAILFEAPVLAGPLLLVPVLAAVSPGGAVISCGVCFGVGAVVFATSRPARAWRDGRRPAAARLGALASPAIRTLAALAAICGGVVGMVQVAAAGSAGRLGEAEQAAWLYASLSAGSLVGTVLYGARRWSGPVTSRLGWMFGGLLAMVIGCAASPTLPLLAVGLFGAGLLLGPITVTCFGGAADHAPAGSEIGGFTILTAASLGAAAAGNASAGALLDVSGPAAAFAVGAGLVMVGIVLVSGAGRGWPPPGRRGR